MADPGVTTLADLLPAKIDGLGDCVQAHLEARPGGLVTLAWGLIKFQAAGRIKDALNIDVLDMAAKAWAAARELHGYADASRHPAGEVEVTHLGKHSLTASVHPVLNIGFAGASFAPMRFTLVLTAEFLSAALSIQDGAIVAVAPGEASAAAVLKYGEVDLHKPLASRPLRLPGVKTFDPGLRIP